MEGQMVNSNTGKSQRDSQIKLITSWHYTGQVSPAFCRLMRVLLEPKDNRVTRPIEEGKDA